MYLGPLFGPNRNLTTEIASSPTWVGGSTASLLAGSCSMRASDPVRSSGD
jgi:hypothetical protein